MASHSCSYELKLAKIGCEVFGIDLKKEVTKEVVKTIKNDVRKHRILIFRDQGIVPPQKHLEISRWFGEVESTYVDQSFYKTFHCTQIFDTFPNENAAKL